MMSRQNESFGPSRPLTGAEKVGVLLLALGKERASGLLKKFNPEELNILVRSTEVMPTISASELEGIVEEAGLQLEAVEVDSIALGRMLPQGRHQSSALLRIEAHSTILYGWHSGQPQQRRELSLGLSTITGALPERLLALLAGEPLPECLLIASCSPVEAGQLQSLGSQLNLPCRMVPDLARLERVDGAMILACALALGGLRR